MTVAGADHDDDSRAQSLAPRLYEPILDMGLLPDFITRTGIRHLLARRSSQCKPGDGSLTAKDQYKLNYIASLRQKATIAINTKEANEQHYEVPTEFFRLHLGERMKYSSCLFEDGR